MSLTASQIVTVVDAANEAYRMIIWGCGSPVPKAERFLDAIDGVKSYVDEIEAGSPDIEYMHDNWVQHRIEQGWQYGSTFDVENKLHPDLVSWSDLSEEQKRKDMLFMCIVKALTVKI